MTVLVKNILLECKGVLLPVLDNSSEGTLRSGCSWCAITKLLKISLLSIFHDSCAGPCLFV